MHNFLTNKDFEQKSDNLSMRDQTISHAGLKFIEEVNDLIGSHPFCRDSNISEKEFFEKCYVKPFDGYMESSSDNPNDDNWGQDDDWGYGTGSLVNIQEKRLAEIDIRDHERYDFEKSLDRYNEIALLIHGQAGTGKSTYARKLAYDRRRICEIHFLTFESYLRSMQLNGISLDMSGKIGYGDEGSKNALWKIVSVTLNQVFHMLEKPNENGEYYLNNIGPSESYLKKLKRISNIHKELFIHQKQFTGDQGADGLDMRRLFDSFCKSTENRVGKSFIKYLTKCFKNYSESEALTLVIEFILRLYCCLYDMDENKHPYICVFDNLEGLIRHFDEERGTARERGGVPIKGLKEFLVIFRNIFDTTADLLTALTKHRKWGNYPFCFLIAAREATTALADIRNVQTIRNNNIEISGWFCTHAIFDKRMDIAPTPEFRNTLMKGPTSEYWKAFIAIMRDISLSRWALYDVVCKMYNYSIRRIARILSKIIAQISDEDISYFNNQWEKAFNRGISYNKYICRQYIFSLLLREISDDYTFSLTSGNRSIVRKIILYLHNYSLQNSSSQIFFIDLVSAVFKGPYHNRSICPIEFDLFIDALYLLNERRWDENWWAALVNVEDGEAHAYIKEDFVRLLKDEWDNQSKVFSVYITNTGHFFASFIADFEYCARGFVEHSNGKLMGQYAYSIWELARKNDENCVKIIKMLRKEIINEINKIIVDIKDFFTTGSTRAGMIDFKVMYSNLSCYCYAETSDSLPVFYPTRLLRRTIGYVDNFLSFLENSPANSKRETIIRKVRIQLMWFLCDSVKCMRKYEDYFRVLPVKSLIARLNELNQHQCSYKCEKLKAAISQITSEQ